MPEDKNSNLTYETAIKKLEQIVTEIEQGNISIDQLSEKVKEAKALFEFCITKLSSIENDVSNILKKMPDTLNQSNQNQ